MDGTKIKANASRHKAMSWAYACKLEAQLRAEVAELIKRAESENGQGQQEINIPAELQRQETRLEKLRKSKLSWSSVLQSAMHSNKPIMRLR